MIGTVNVTGADILTSGLVFVKAASLLCIRRHFNPASLNLFRSGAHVNIGVCFIKSGRTLGGRESRTFAVNAPMKSVNARKRGKVYNTSTFALT